MTTELREQRLAAGVLLHLPLLAGVPAPQVAALAQSCRTLRFCRGDAVVRRQAGLPGIFAVAYGTVKLVLGGADRYERVLRLVGAGQTFGEASALLGRPADYDALALAECKLVVLPTAAILDLAEREPRFARNALHVLAHRVVGLLDELQAATLQCGSQRLAAYLESLAAAGGPGPTRIHLPVSKTILAARLGVKKETLSRLLRQFATRGLIEIERRDIALLDRGRLAAMVRAELT